MHGKNHQNVRRESQKIPSEQEVDRLFRFGFDSLHRSIGRFKFDGISRKASNVCTTKQGLDQGKNLCFFAKPIRNLGKSKCQFGNIGWAKVGTRRPYVLKSN